MALDKIVSGLFWGLTVLDGAGVPMYAMWRASSLPRSEISDGRMMAYTLLWGLSTVVLGFVAYAIYPGYDIPLRD